MQFEVTRCRAIALSRDLALLGLLSLLWGSSFALIKLGVATIPPITLIAARTVVAGSLLLAVLRVRGVRLPTDAATWRLFLAQAFLNSVVPFTLIAWGERTLGAGLATILNSTSPIFAFLLARFLAPGRRPDGCQLFGVVAGLTGVALIVGPQALTGLGAELGAELAIVTATICYAGAAMFGRQFRGLDPMLPAAGSLICGAAVLTPLSMIVDRPWSLAPSATSIWAVICLATFATALALVIYFYLLETLGPVGATSQSYLRVPVGVAISIGWLGETLSSTAAIGLVCVIAGVAAMTVALPAAFVRLFDRRMRWITACLDRSRQRRRLAELDDDLLDDIGRTRAQALDEARRPFWKP